MSASGRCSCRRGTLRRITTIPVVQADRSGPGPIRPGCFCPQPKTTATPPATSRAGQAVRRTRRRSTPGSSPTPVRTPPFARSGAREEKAGSTSGFRARRATRACAEAATHSRRRLSRSAKRARWSARQAGRAAASSPKGMAVASASGRWRRCARRPRSPAVARAIRLRLPAARRCRPRPISWGPAHSRWRSAAITTARCACPTRSTACLVRLAPTGARSTTAPSVYSPARRPRCATCGPTARSTTLS